MCGCTLYDSPTCGHTWLSMSQPCGFLRDLLNCPNRYTFQTLIAPPFACPQCNGGFADCETIEMVQGPWGCNQMIRSHLGGSHVIPGSWGNVPMVTNNCGPGLGMGMGVGMGVGMEMAVTSNMPLIASSRAMIPTNSHGYDHRLTGPYGSHPAIYTGPDFLDTDMIMDDGFYGCFDCDYGYGYSGRRRRRNRHRSSSRYTYHHSSGPSTACAVM